MAKGKQMIFAYKKILFFLAITIVGFTFPCLILAQTVDISVSAMVATSSSEYCGDGICNSSENCSSCPADCGGCSGGGGGGVVIIHPETTVIFKGMAYPNAAITILRNDSVIASFPAQSSGIFERTVTGVAAGTYGFSVFAEDTEGRKSVTVGFTVGILSGRTTTISGILISPTIELGPTQVERGDVIDIYGQAFPQSQINIFINSREIIKNASSTAQGRWQYELNTEELEESEHTARAKVAFETGELSPFSHALNFLVVKKGSMVCRGPDLNFDEKINLVDFSILLYYWQQKNPKNICADINLDGNVDLIDFSIMMYYWSR